MLNQTNDNSNEILFPSVGLKLTGACRLRCPFCCEPDRGQEVHPIDNFIKIAQKLKQLGTQRLCLTGGDPLLYPHITDLIKQTNSLGFFNLLLTSDGALLKEKHEEILPYLGAIRFSIHAICDKHDQIVGEPGAFQAIDYMIDFLGAQNIPRYVTTVVSNLNVQYVHDIAKWCADKNIAQHFIFGLMKSGNGKGFIDEIGEVSKETLSKLVSTLQATYSQSPMRIIYYDYSKKSECILVYGDGRIVIDPDPTHPSFQSEIGNVLEDSVDKLSLNFKNDQESYNGYTAHLEMTPQSFPLPSSKLAESL